MHIFFIGLEAEYQQTQSFGSHRHALLKNYLLVVMIKPIFCKVMMDHFSSCGGLNTVVGRAFFMKG